VPTKGVAISELAKSHASCQLIHFVRHAEGFHNAADRKHGTDILTFKNSGSKYVDAKLNENGKAQCAALRENIESGSYEFSVEHPAIDGQYVLDTELVVASTLSRTIETAKYGLPWIPPNGLYEPEYGEEPPIIATDLGRERIREYMCEKRRTLTELVTDYPYLHFAETDSEVDSMFDHKEHENNMEIAKIRAKRFINWLASLGERKIAYVSHFEFLQLLFRESFEELSGGMAKMKDSSITKEIFPWNFKFKNAEIASLYLCKKHIFQTATCNPQTMQEQVLKMEELEDDARKQGKLYTLESPGPFKGKEQSHTPIGKVNRTTGDITFSVPHPFENDHFIQYMYYKRTFASLSVENALIGDVVEFSPSVGDNSASLSFTPMEGETGTIVPFAYCNKHGLWQGEPVDFGLEHNYEHGEL
jgi:desulfoferrodoxin (superoxide reductase-like protein)/broad specificity phosphatase PhoE